MKFNWKSNWEILVVLVIIVVGIVITTIAAIRNKDKHLLIVPDDSDYSQLLANSGVVPTETSSPVLRQQQQTDLHLHNALPIPEEEMLSTRRPQPQPMAKMARPIRERQELTSGGGQRNQDRSKYDDSAEFNRPDQQPVTLGANYVDPQEASDNSGANDIASSSRGQSDVNLEGKYQSESHNHSKGNVARRQSSNNNNRRHVNRAQQAHKNEEASQQLDEIVDQMDDIHTTRSSLAGNSFMSSGSKGTTADQNEQAPMTPSLSLLGPYSVTPPSSPFSQLIIHNSKALEPQVGDTEDMMTSYSRIPVNTNLSDILVRNYNLAAALNELNSNSTRQAHTQFNSVLLSDLLSPQQTAEATPSSDSFDQLSSPMPLQSHLRAYTSASPISLLLGDLIKLARPQQQSVNGSRERTSSNGSNRSQMGILQQLRSLPGPLLAALQSLSPSGDRFNNDASESNQHYHRVSLVPSDAHSILVRSLASSSVLPAFPAPKGSPQNWIPPTAGGDPTYHDANNINADFVASNVAGFVRNMQQSGNEQSSYHQQTQVQRDDFSQKQQTNNEATLLMHQNTENHRNSANNNGGQSALMNLEQAQQQQQQQQQQHHSARVQSSGQQLANGGLDKTWNEGMSGALSGGRTNLAGSEQSIDNRQYKPNNIQFHLNSPVESKSALGSQQNMGQKLVQMMPQYQASFSQNSGQNLGSGEIQVPLGYAPTQMQPYRSNGQISRLQSEQNSVSIESSPKASVVELNGAFNNYPTRQILINQKESKQVIPLKGLTRRKRALRDRDVEEISGDETGEDDEDSQPMSVVRLDGRPMNSGRIRGQPFEKHRTSQSSRDLMNDPQVAQSERSANLLTMKKPRKKQSKRFPSSSHNFQSLVDLSSNRHKSLGLAKPYTRGHQNEDEIYRGRGFKNSRQLKKNVALDVAGSGLMSKLLGTASTNDELEDELDDDDESANERRKEEADDAEFGIVNDERFKRVNEIHGNSDRNTQPESKLNDGGLGSGSTDKESYSSRRQQQRSDIEFYGHPGEETRQLKYGILGSGNYEVVNGGVYPDAEESTAAVNSVANYVRKPGNLLSGLPKLLAEHSRETLGPEALMPGDRLGGYVREISGNPDELVNFMPATEINRDISRPMIDLIDPNTGQIFDPNMYTQISSSGSAAKITHTSKDSPEDAQDVGGKHYLRGDKNLSEHLKAKSRHKIKDDGYNEFKYDSTLANSRHQKQNQIYPDTHLQQQQSSISGSRSQGTNQFNAYQISPSKKVTIFSDQDLDSAPNEINEIFHHRNPLRSH